MMLFYLQVFEVKKYLSDFFLLINKYSRIP